MVLVILWLHLSSNGAIKGSEIEVECVCVCERDYENGGGEDIQHTAQKPERQGEKHCEHGHPSCRFPICSFYHVFMPHGHRKTTAEFAGAAYCSLSSMLPLMLM